MQFIRNGYFIKDNKEGNEIVYNNTVNLKDTFKA